MGAEGGNRLGCYGVADAASVRRASGADCDGPLARTGDTACGTDDQPDAAGRYVDRGLFAWRAQGRNWRLVDHHLGRAVLWLTLLQLRRVGKPRGRRVRIAEEKR